MHTSRMLLAPLLAGGLLLGCGDVGTEAARADSILGGYNAVPGYRGAVQVYGAGACSGVALRNDWVFTAYGAGCLLQDQIQAPTTIRVVYMGVNFTPDAALHYESGDTYDTTLSGVLLHLSTPMTIGGSTTGFRQDLTPSISYSPSDPFECLGYGNNTATGGAGTLRRAFFLPYGSVGASRFNIRANAGGQIPVASDIGGPCFDSSGVRGVMLSATSTQATYTAGGGGISRWSTMVMDAAGPPQNDVRGNALRLGENAPWEQTVWGTTLGATHDGPSVPCYCTSGGDIWYRFDVAQRELRYFDTAGSSFDTSLLVTDASGNPLAGDALQPGAGRCNDDAYCGTGAGFTSSLQSRIAGVFEPGTYYLVVGGCGAGRVVLHHQHASITPAGTPDHVATFVDAPMQGDGYVSSAMPGGDRGYTVGTCGGRANDQLRWLVSCGAQPQFFSLCKSDGGSFTRQLGPYIYDPALRLRSAQTARDIRCNDDGGIEGGTDCSGTGGDASQYGSRLGSPSSTRGLNLLFVDERTGAPAFPGIGGMVYQLHHTVR